MLVQNEIGMSLIFVTLERKEVGGIHNITDKDDSTGKECSSDDSLTEVWIIFHDKPLRYVFHNQS